MNLIWRHTHTHKRDDLWSDESPKVDPATFHPANVFISISSFLNGTCRERIDAASNKLGYPRRVYFILYKFAIGAAAAAVPTVQASIYNNITEFVMWRER
jgi:hypothetical protein